MVLMLKIIWAQKCKGPSSKVTGPESHNNP
jgi:hypothetical protein